jgi:hypothetical protein
MVTTFSKVKHLTIPVHADTVHIPSGTVHSSCRKQIQITHAPCFLLSFDDDYRLTTIQQYEHRRLLRAYEYSHKGNLARQIVYPADGLHERIVTHYDYSIGEQRIKEIRFYGMNSKYTRKDCYLPHAYRHEIIYYFDGVPYCREFLDEKGELIKAIHYSDSGLAI